jgi:predicted enzyme related to lactoylglutathione lyase
MWRRPGYGELLAQRDPELRRRHAEDGVPSGFSDAIGWLAPLPDDAPANAAGWSVTFSVADADAIAETAQRLGGKIVTAPYDAGGIARVTVVADPQGAVFTASQFLGLR